MKFEFEGEIWIWKGPAPWYFVTVPAEQSDGLRAISGMVTYGWGMIPVRARIGGSAWKTSLYPQDGGYVLPVKASIRRAEGLAEGDFVRVEMEAG